jgi:uncharacterized oxidoreductase
MQLSHNKVLVTGGASGIGRGLTERFLKDNNTVIICGRREDALREMAAQHPGLITKKCDLELSEERAALYHWIAKEHPDTNVLVNNAGIQNWMNITEKDFFERAQKEIAINIEAPLHLTALFLGLPALRTVLNVTSGLAFVPRTSLAVYSATKAFFHSFTLSLRHLLKDHNIEVIEVVPPALNTDLGGKGLHDEFPPVSEFIESIFRQLAENKQQLTFGFSDAMTKAGPEQQAQAFARMNP